MKLLEINPCLRLSARLFSLSQHNDFVMAYDYRLIYVLKGELDCTFENFSISISENQILIIPPAVKYMFKGNPECDFIVLNFDMDCNNSDYEIPEAPCSIDEFDPKKILSTKLYNEEPLLLCCTDRIRNTLKELINVFAAQDIYYKEKSSVLLKSVIVDSVIFTSLDKTPKTVNDVKQYIEENFNKNITNSVLGDIFRYHPNHLNRLFKTHTNMSIHEFVIDLRLTKSAEMITTSDCPISEIGYLCGFSSGAYFTKKFKDRFGISPLKFRNKKSDKV